MPLFLPTKHGRSGTKDEVIFELGLPSLNEIVKQKRRRLDATDKQDANFVCMLEDKANTNDMDGHDMVHGGGGKHKGEGQRWQGKLSYPIVGTAKYCKPQSIGDVDKRSKKILTEKEVKDQVTAADEHRTAIGIELFDICLM